MNYKPSPLQVKLGESLLMESQKAESKVWNTVRCSWNHVQISMHVADHASPTPTAHTVVVSL